MSGRRYDLTFAGRDVILVAPDRPDPKRRWVWRAEFFGAYPAVDDALLDLGYHQATIRLSDRFGCPSAVADMETFRSWLTDTYQLSPRAALFGFSRGGLYACNYAARYPQHVAALYLDAPVMSLLSWPAGLGDGPGSPENWALCKACYGLSDETAARFRGNPLDQVDRLLAHRIPIVLVAGDQDEVVPLAENGALLIEAYRQGGGTIAVFIKPGCGHHPHSLEDPTPVVDFIRRF
jgi:pimeloyl-ACP methyl ester carboxylesterase